MATSLKDFNNSKQYDGLYISKKKDERKGVLYLANFNTHGKQIRRQLGWSIKDNIGKEKAAYSLLEKLREKVERSIIQPKTNMTVDELYEEYFSLLDDTQWTKNKRNIYEGKIKDALGSKLMVDVLPVDIEKILADLKRRGLKPRTQKGVLEVLKPMYKHAVKNRYIKVDDDPTLHITVKLKNQKRIVTNASKKFIALFDAVMECFKDDAFHRAMYLFFITGRRREEVLKLEWEFINFDKGIYVLDETKEDEQQVFALIPQLEDALNEMKSNRKGLVFPSPVTGGKLKNIEKHTEAVRELSGITNFTLHYSRNILVSALAEEYVNTLVLSQMLGHRDPNTLKKYLSQNYLLGSKEGNAKILELVSANE